MDIINHAVGIPDVQYIQLIPALVYFLLIIHIPFMGLVTGSGMLSVFYRSWKPEVGREFSRLSVVAPFVWMALGILPPLALGFLLKSLYIESPIPVHLYLLVLTAVLFLCFVLLTIYRYTMDIRIGGIAVLGLLFYGFYVSNIMALMMYPEKWPFLKTALPHPLHSITGVIHFFGFIAMALLMTGAGILFFFFRWQESKIPEDSPHYRLFKYHGLGFLLAGALVLPPILVWDLYTLPRYTFSFGIFILAALILLGAFLLSLCASHFLFSTGTLTHRFITLLLVMVFLTMGLVVAKDRMLQANSILDSSGALADKAQSAREQWLVKRQALYPSAKEADAEMGKQIYEQRCAACHQLDKKKLGPPMNETIAKYAGNEERLTSFLRKPVKVDPDYPAMPNPGLTEFQIKSVVSYLLSTQEATE